METEGLSAICAGLGFFANDGNGNRIGFEKGEFCLDNLKDLLRFFRREDPRMREVFKQVCKWNVISQKLIPILESGQDDRNLVLNVVKVLVFLTMPIEPSSSDIPQQIEYLWGLKLAITGSDTVAAILFLLESPLENLQHEAFTEDDWKIVQLVLTFFRNVLAIQDISSMQKADGSAIQFLSLRDRFLELLFNENVMDLILVLTQHVGGSCRYLRQDNLLLLDIFHYVFMGQDAELIARAQLTDLKAEEDTRASLDPLSSFMEEEKEKRKFIRLRNLSRHSQFSGTFTKFTMDGSKMLFKGNPGSASCDPLLKTQKAHRGPLKRTVWDFEVLPSMKNKIFDLLHEFLNQLLSGGYNVLMQSIREDIEKEHPSIQNSDVVAFFRVAHFVMSFQYHKLLTYKPNLETDSVGAFTEQYANSTLFKGDVCGPIAESMNESMFLLVVSKWRNAFDGLKETNDFKFLSATGSLMKIMIRMLDLVLKLSPNASNETQTARILLYKLFYDQTDEGVTHFLFTLIKTFDSHKQSKSDLADLIEMIHVIMRLMENLQAHGTLRVARKSKKGKQKTQLDEKKDNIEELNRDHATPDAEIGITNCENSTDLSMQRLQNSGNFPSVQPENVLVPGHVDGAQTYLAEACNFADNNTNLNKSPEFVNDDLNCGTGDSSGDEQFTNRDEVDFKVSTLVLAIANNIVIHNLCWLLKFYKSNSVRTNHYVLCMFRRICDDLDLSPMLYQLSYLTTFYNILVEQKSNPCKDYENIVHFLTTLVRRMLRKLKNQSLLFVDLLFSKTRRECHEINADSLLQELGSLKKATNSWANANGNGYSGSSQGKGVLHRSIADALGDDEADVVIPYDSVNQRAEDQYGDIHQDIMPISDTFSGKTMDSALPISDNDDGMKDNSNYVGQHEVQKVPKRRRRLVVDAELEKKVAVLYEKYKSDRHCCRLIAEALDLDEEVSPAQVSNMLKCLGIKSKPRKKTLNGDVPCAVGIEENEKVKLLGSRHSRLEAKESEASSIGALRSRKRVRAFSKEQEAIIKALFEKFKDHKRCSNLIANALDADGAFSAIQVSRKLKELGLSVPRGKNSKANMKLIDEDLNDHFTEDAHNSDDETLLSFKKRKSRMSAKREKDGKLAATLVPGLDNSETGCVLDHSEGHEPGQHKEMGAPEVVAIARLNNSDPRDNLVAEETGVSSGERSDAELVSSTDHISPEQLNDMVTDELEDSGDNETPVTSLEVPARRKRMVIDFDEDE